MIAAPCDAVKRAIRNPFPATPARFLPVDTAILIVAGAVCLGMLPGEIPGLALAAANAGVGRGAKWRRPRGCC
jgi:hypothetical protein